MTKSHDVHAHDWVKGKYRKKRGQGEAGGWGAGGGHGKHTKHF